LEFGVWWRRVTLSIVCAVVIVVGIIVMMLIDMVGMLMIWIVYKQRRWSAS
jgi:hypothetical protein